MIVAEKLEYLNQVTYLLHKKIKESNNFVYFPLIPVTYFLK